MVMITMMIIINKYVNVMIHNSFNTHKRKWSKILTWHILTNQNKIPLSCWPCVKSLGLVKAGRTVHPFFPLDIIFRMAYLTSPKSHVYQTCILNYYANKQLTQLSVYNLRQNISTFERSIRLKYFFIKRCSTIWVKN